MFIGVTSNIISECQHALSLFSSLKYSTRLLLLTVGVASNIILRNIMPRRIVPFLSLSVQTLIYFFRLSECPAFLFQSATTHCPHSPHYQYSTHLILLNVKMATNIIPGCHHALPLLSILSIFNTIISFDCQSSKLYYSRVLKHIVAISNIFNYQLNLLLRTVKVPRILCLSYF